MGLFVNPPSDENPYPVKIGSTTLPSDPSKNGSKLVLPLAGFVNPSYIGATAGSAVADSLGLDISDAAEFVVGIENGATATVISEQTMDPTGLVGWIAVPGVSISNVGATAAT